MPFNHIQKGVLEEIFNAHAGATEVMDLAAAQGLVAFFEKDEVGSASPTFTGSSSKGVNYKAFLVQLESAIKSGNNEAIVDSVLGASVGFVFCAHGHGGVAQQDPEALLILPAKHRIPLEALKDPLEVLTGGLTESIVHKLWAKATEGTEGGEEAPQQTVDRAGFVHFLRELRKKAMFTKPTILCDSIRTLRAKHGLPLAPQPEGVAGGQTAESPSLKRTASSVFAANRFSGGLATPGSRGGQQQPGSPNFETQDADGSQDGANSAQGQSTPPALGLTVSESAPSFGASPKAGSPGPHMLRQSTAIVGGSSGPLPLKSGASESAASPLASLRKVQPGATPQSNLTVAPVGVPLGRRGSAFAVPPSPPQVAELGIQTEEGTQPAAVSVQEQATAETQTSRPPTPPPPQVAAPVALPPHVTSAQMSHLLQEQRATPGSLQNAGPEVSKESFYKTLSIVEGQNQLLLHLRKQLYDASIAHIEAQEDKLLNDEPPAIVKSTPPSFATPSAPSPARTAVVPTPQYQHAAQIVVSNTGIPPSAELLRQPNPEGSRIAGPLSHVQVATAQHQNPGAALEAKVHQYETMDDAAGQLKLDRDLERYESVLRKWEHDIEAKEFAARRLLELRKREAMVRIQGHQEDSARLDVSRPGYSNVILGAKEFAANTGHVYVDTSGDYDGGESMITSTGGGGGGSSLGGARRKQWGPSGSRPAPSVIHPETLAARDRKAAMMKEQQALRAAGANKSNASSGGGGTPRHQRSAVRRELITPTAVERSLYPRDTPAPRSAFQQAQSALSGSEIRAAERVDTHNTSSRIAGGGAHKISPEDLATTFNGPEDALLMHVLRHQWHPSFSN